MTTLAQSVSGMKPILTSAFSGASDPAAQTPLWPRVEKKVAAAAPFLMKSRRPVSVAGAAAVAGVLPEVMSNSFKVKNRWPKSTTASIA